MPTRCLADRVRSPRPARPERPGRGAVARRVVALLLVASMLGCGGIGPGALEGNRTRYNVAIQRTDAQELLLNLVRLRYRDTPFFLQVSSVSANLRFQAGLEAGGAFLDGGADVATIDGSLAVEESPTMTYTPLQGEKFVKQMLEPVQLEVLLWLSYSGWSIDRALRLLVQEVNGVPNAPRASGPTPTSEPEFSDFLRVTGILRDLQERQLLRIATSPGDLRDIVGEEDRARLYLVLEPEALELPEIAVFCELLGLEGGKRAYEMVVRLGPPSRNQISIVPRSITSAMYYASQGVEIPGKDEEEGRVTVTTRDDGSRFDWTELTGDLFRVQSGKRPRGAYVAVEYRGHWFYINDDDLESKSTFSLLNLVLALQAGDVPSAAPILTLPVSR